MRRPEWTDIPVTDRYTITLEVIGGRILLSRPKGYATREAVKRVGSLQARAMKAAISAGRSHVYLGDYTDLEGVAAGARRYFSTHLSRRPDLIGLVFFGTSPLDRLSIKLLSRWMLRRFAVEIVPDYSTAMRRAVALLKQGGESKPVEPPLETPADGESVPESGAIELEDYEVSYEVIDGHIMHGHPVGMIGLHEIKRQLELENMVIASLDRSRGNPVIVADAGGIEGLTAAARRLYVMSLRNRQKHSPISLFVFYNVRPFLRNAINISRPFLPFRMRIARDRHTAFEIARREAHPEARGPVDRLRSLLLPGSKTEKAPPPPDVDDLLDLISNIDWENDGPMEVDPPISAEDPLAPVVDALELIKADVDELFRARRRTEAALRESEERYRNILDSIVDGYYEIDFDGRLLLCNDSLLRIFGFGRADIENLDPASLLKEDDQKIAIDTFRRVAATRQPAHAIEWEMLRKDGSPISVEASIALVTDGDDLPVGYRGIIRDISGRVRAAREKADLEAQLQRSQRMEAIGTLAGGIAHNFNNLLMGIQGNISLMLREHPSENPHAKRLATIEALVDGGSKLTSQLLGYARSGRVEVRIVDLNELVLETAETFSLTRREYRIHTDLCYDQMPIEVDPTQIDQALLNLLINAADAMPRGGDIHLSSRLVPHAELVSAEFEIAEGNHAVVSVRDTGHGMDQDTLERCFEPFFTTKGMSGGTGLGLASAYGIIRAHGGLIEARSVVGEGSTFSFSFPTTADGPESTARVRGQPVSGEGTILVVDDDEMILDACAEMLSLLNYTPICAASGAAAVDIFERRRDDIDLVVLDLILTDLNGGEVFDRIRAIDPTARVLLASGYSLEGEAAGLLERGCDDFIQKPFTMEQLSLKLDGLLGRSS